MRGGTYGGARAGHRPHCEAFHSQPEPLFLSFRAQPRNLKTSSWRQAGSPRNVRACIAPQRSATASDSSAALGITMALLRPHKVMKMGCCLPVGSRRCRACPPLRPTMGTGFPRYDGVGVVRPIFIAMTSKHARHDASVNSSSNGCSLFPNPRTREGSRPYRLPAGHATPRYFTESTPSAPLCPPPCLRTPR